jgi:CheY-like chemotaxis protein
VADGSAFRALLYEGDAENARAVVYGLANLGIPHTWVDNEDSFIQEMKTGGYTHVFSSHANKEAAIGLAEVMKVEGVSEPLVVVMAEYGAAVTDPRVRVISMPAHALLLANVFNNAGGGLPALSFDFASFTAPDARALIVDDVNTNLTVAAGLMRPVGIEITLAHSGLEAIDSFKRSLLTKERRFDLVFMDHMMPGMNGIEAVHIIRELEDEAVSSHVPIIALTANAVAGMKESFLSQGFDDYLPKPIEAARLNMLIAKWLPDSKRVPLTPEGDSPAPEEAGGGESTQEALARELGAVCGIDTKAGAEHTGGLDNLFEVIRQFCNDFEQLMGNIQTTYADKNWKDYAIYVHAAKGILATIGADKLSDQAKRLELAGKAGDAAVCEAETPALIDALNAFYTALRGTALFADTESGGVETNTINLADAKNKLDTLAKACYNADSYIIDPLIDSLKHTALEEPYTELWTRSIDDIARLTESYEFESAEHAIAALAEEIEHFT